MISLWCHNLLLPINILSENILLRPQIAMDWFLGLTMRFGGAKKGGDPPPTPLQRYTFRALHIMVM